MFLNKIFEIAHAYTTNILFVILTGSYAFKIKNNHDIDIMVVVDGKNIYTQQSVKNNDGVLVDLFIMSYDSWRQMCPYAYLSLQYAKIYPENLLYGKLPDENAFKTKVGLTEALYKQYKQGLLGPLVSEDKKNGNCLKRMYWGLMIYYTYLNNGSFNFTQEQLDIIQKCHDRELPISYRDELKANMEKILKEKGFIN